MRLTIIISPLLFLFYNLHAQKTAVPNDNASNAVVLFVDSNYYQSNTTNCTIEENCISRVSTAKCLIYHNDQWFTFYTSDSTTYYLSVKNQNCKDINGVQLILIEGDLCKPETYTYLECVSLATQDDISLTLKQLKPNQQYIINLDGYLNDHCQFEIGISKTPPTFHLDTDHQIQVSSEVKNGIIEFNWQLNQELIDLGITEFEIMRRYQSEKRFSRRRTIYLDRTVSGDYNINYSYTDSLYKTGVYHYQIIAVSASGKRYIVSTHAIHSNETNNVNVNSNLVPLELNLRRNTAISINIFAEPSEQFLGNYKATYNPGFVFDLKPYLQKNPEVKTVLLVITEMYGKFKKQLIVDVNGTISTGE